MKRLLLLLLLSAPAFAGTLTLDGKPCGTVAAVTLTPEWNVLVATTDKLCGPAGQPEEPPPPTPVPCPDCEAATWPVIPQKLYTLAQGEVLTLSITTTDAGATGRLVTNYTTGDTAAREVSLSVRPGDFAVAPSCKKAGLQMTSHYWQQGGTSTSRCILPPNSQAYINVRTTNCEAGQRCRFLLSAN